MIYLFLTMISAIFIVLVGDFTQISLLYMISVIGIMVFKAKETTILHLCAGLLLFKSIELTALFIIPTRASMGYDIPHVWLNNNNFLIHLVFDVCVLLFLLYRPPISRTYLRCLVFPRGRKHTDEELTYSQAEVWLISVILLYFCVDVAALIENLIRNMDYLGVPEEFAQNFYEWTFVFYAYEPVKNLLNLLELAAIWFSVSRSGGKRTRKPEKFKAAVNGLF